MDNSLFEASALIIELNTSSRSLMSMQLRDLGLTNIRQTGRPRDARAILENKKFDIVLCGYSFESGEMNGQEFLDELRRCHLLPYSTVFVMITAEASYARVSEVAEAALDAYLIKPYTSAALAERLAQARFRKRVLKDIFDALEKEEFALAATLCLKRFATRAQFWLYAARIGAELLLKMNRNDEARKLYDAIIAAHTVPWARLGVARVEMAVGNLSAARRSLEALVGDLPDYADSYDMMGHVLMEQGEVKEALNSYRRAANLTPGCLARMQRCGTLAFYAGQRGEAQKMFERAMTTGLNSKLFDPMSLMLLGFMRYDGRDVKALRYAHDAMVQALEHGERLRRMERFELAFRCLRSMLERKTGEALELARWLSIEAQQGDFDLEAAGVLLALWTRLIKLDAPSEEADSVVTRVGLRFCTSKASTEVLVAMVEGYESAVNELRACHTRIFGVAETAMRHAMRGTPSVGVELLIQQGETTRNAKLIDMAGLVLRRQQEKIEDAAIYAERIAVLHRRFVEPMAAAGGTRQKHNSGAVALPG